MVPEGRDEQCGAGSEIDDERMCECQGSEEGGRERGREDGDWRGRFTRREMEMREIGRRKEDEAFGAADLAEEIGLGLEIVSDRLHGLER